MQSPEGFGSPSRSSDAGLKEWIVTDPIDVYIPSLINGATPQLSQRLIVALRKEGIMTIGNLFKADLNVEAWMGLGVKLGSTAKTICTRVRQDKTKRPIYINTLVKDYLDVYTSLPMNTCEQIAERLEEDGDIASFAMLKEINDEELLSLLDYWVSNEDIQVLCECLARDRERISTSQSAAASISPGTPMYATLDTGRHAVQSPVSASLRKTNSPAPLPMPNRPAQMTPRSSNIDRESGLRSQLPQDLNHEPARPVARSLSGSLTVSTLAQDSLKRPGGAPKVGSNFSGPSNAKVAQPSNTGAGAVRLVHEDPGLSIKFVQSLLAKIQKTTEVECKEGVLTEDECHQLVKCCVRYYEDKKLVEEILNVVGLGLIYRNGKIQKWCGITFEGRNILHSAVQFLRESDREEEQITALRTLIGLCDSCKQNRQKLCTLYKADVKEGWDIARFIFNNLRKTSETENDLVVVRDIKFWSLSVMSSLMEERDALKLAFTEETTEDYCRLVHSAMQAYPGDVGIQFEAMGVAYATSARRASLLNGLMWRCAENIVAVLDRFPKNYHHDAGSNAIDKLLMRACECVLFLAKKQDYKAKLVAMNVFDKVQKAGMRNSAIVKKKMHEYIRRHLVDPAPVKMRSTGSGVIRPAPKRLHREATSDHESEKDEDNTTEEGSVDEEYEKEEKEEEEEEEELTDRKRKKYRLKSSASRSGTKEEKRDEEREDNSDESEIFDWKFVKKGKARVPVPRKGLCFYRQWQSFYRKGDNELPFRCGQPFIDLDVYYVKGTITDHRSVHGVEEWFCLYDDWVRPMYMSLLDAAVYGDWHNVKYFKKKDMILGPLPSYLKVIETEAERNILEKQAWRDIVKKKREFLGDDEP